MAGVPPRNINILSAKDSAGTLKKKRSANWLEQDKALLQDLVRERVRVIENKDTDTNTNSQKQKAWLSVQENFNNLTICQLKSQWGVIKMVAKKEISFHRSEVLKTGGGPPPSSNPLSSTDISAWLPGEFVVDYNEFDSDLNDACLVETLFSDMEMLDDDDEKKEISPPALLAKSHTNLELSLASVSQQPKVLPRKRKTLTAKESAADAKIKKIADCDIECRRELHLIQMENERKRGRNLDLEHEILLQKFKNEKE